MKCTVKKTKIGVGSMELIPDRVDPLVANLSWNVTLIFCVTNLFAPIKFRNLSIWNR